MIGHLLTLFTLAGGFGLVALSLHDIAARRVPVRVRTADDRDAAFSASEPR